MGAQTPMSKLVRRGRTISTVDMAGREQIVSTSPNADMASWLFGPLRRFHEGAVEVVDEEGDPEPELEPTAELRRRLAAGLGLCPCEHHVEDLTGGGSEWIVGWRCDGWPEGHRKMANLGSKTSVDVTRDIQANVSRWQHDHEREIAHRALVELLSRIDGAAMMITGLVECVHDFVTHASSGIEAGDDVVERGKRAIGTAAAALHELQLQGIPR